MNDAPVHRALARLFPAEPDANVCVAEFARRARDLLGDTAWVDALIAPLAEALREQPYRDPPFRVSRDPVRLGAILFENRIVSITAAIVGAHAQAALPPPRTIVVPGRMAVVRYVRCGGARLRLWEAEPAASDFSASAARPCVAIGERRLTDGAVLTLDGRTLGTLVEAGVDDIVTLTATIHAGEAPFMREYAIDTGALVRVAALDGRASRTQMLLAWLRVSGRADAGARFDAATRDDAFFVRWSALREWLALDARAALPRLREMAANDVNREVREAAGATLAMLTVRAAPLEIA